MVQGRLDPSSPSTLEGLLGKIVYEADSGFAVVRLIPDGSEVEVTAVGPLGGIPEGFRVKLWGQWVVDGRFGRQFRVERSEVRPPSTREGLVKYLASRWVEGVGPKIAEAIVDRFGADTMEVLEKTPDRLSEVKDVGPKRLKKILASLERSQGQRAVMVFLGGIGVGPEIAQRIRETYGEDTMRVLHQDPYRLVEDVRGVGFRTADQIAMKCQLDPRSPARFKAAIHQVLEDSSRHGHVYMPEPELVPRVRELLGATTLVEESDVTPRLHDLEASHRLIVEEKDGTNRLYPAYLHRAEREVVAELSRLIGSPPLFRPLSNEGIGALERGLGVQYHPAQQEALRSLSTTNLLVVTGGPGTGKTTLIRGIVELARMAGLELELAAPTGRAAKRMEESTGVPASTIHRLLGLTPHSRPTRAHGAEEPLQGISLLIVDEVSMIDLPLMQKLLKAVPRGAALVLVGDHDQLPSIGPGNVLKDLIECRRLPLVELTHVFRQAQESLIIANAHRIREGLLPESARAEGGDPAKADYFFMKREDPAELAATVVELVTGRLPRFAGVDPMKDIQVLVPMYRGEAGIDHLNELLAKSLNPGGATFSDRPPPFRLGDKVIHGANDYEREVFNGDTGIVRQYDAGTQRLTVDFDGRLVQYTPAELKDLSLAYAISIHKSQGSEYPVVVLPLHTQHYLLLHRNLLYTAVSRARKLVVIVGSQRALQLAVSNESAERRHSGLGERLRAALSSP